MFHGSVRFGKYDIYKRIQNRIRSSKEGKTVFANLGYLTLLQVAGYVFPLITMPYLARVIGADGFGKIAFATAVVVWFQTVADWGFNLTATRDVAQNRYDKNVVSRIFSNVFWSRCLLSIISGILLLLLIAIVPYFRENAAVILITFLIIPGQIMFPDWMFQAIEKMKYTTIFNITMKLIFTVAVFIFIRDKEDYLVQPILVTMGYFVCGIGALYLILHKWGYALYKPKWHEVIKTIKGSADVFINNIMPNFTMAFLFYCWASLVELLLMESMMEEINFRQYFTNFKWSCLGPFIHFWPEGKTSIAFTQN